MRYALAPVALAALAAATPVPQGVTESITPDSSAPSDCQTSYDGTFNIQIVNVSDSSSKRSIHKVSFTSPMSKVKRKLINDSVNPRFSL